MKLVSPGATLFGLRRTHSSRWKRALCSLAESTKTPDPPTFRISWPPSAVNATTKFITRPRGRGTVRAHGRAVETTTIRGAANIAEISGIAVATRSRDRSRPRIIETKLSRRIFPRSFLHSPSYPPLYLPIRRNVFVAGRVAGSRGNYDRIHRSGTGEIGWEREEKGR